MSPYVAFQTDVAMLLIFARPRLVDDMPRRQCFSHTGTHLSGTLRVLPLPRPPSLCVTYLKSLHTNLAPSESRWRRGSSHFPSLNTSMQPVVNSLIGCYQGMFPSHLLFPAFPWCPLVLSACSRSHWLRPVRTSVRKHSKVDIPVLFTIRGACLSR